MNTIGLFVGLFLVGFIQFSSLQSGRRYGYTEHDDLVSYDMVYTTIQKYMCTAKSFLPVGVEDIFQGNVIIYITLAVFSTVLTIYFSCVKRNNIFKSIIMYPLTLGNNALCSVVKTQFLWFVQSLSNPFELSANLIQHVPFIEKLTQTFPIILTCIELLKNHFIAIGGTTPIFMLVLGLLLLLKRTKNYTRYVCIPLTVFLPSILVSIDIYGQTHQMGLSVLCCLLLFIVISLILNSILSFGQFLLLPSILVDCCAIVIQLYRYFDVEVFILFSIVYVFVLFHLYFWNKSNIVMASTIIYFGIAQLISLGPGYYVPCVLIFFQFSLNVK
ncbi:Uncharacterized protein QTN25_006459 [Entamoeba marina]